MASQLVNLHLESVDLTDLCGLSSDSVRENIEGGSIIARARDSMTTADFKAQVVHGGLKSTNIQLKTADGSVNAIDVNPLGLQAVAGLPLQWSGAGGMSLVRGAMYWRTIFRGMAIRWLRCG